LCGVEGELTGFGAIAWRGVAVVLEDRMRAMVASKLFEVGNV
jgi:hypothetical protein